MKESCRKGVPNHPDLEFCGDRREAVAEALTEASVGWVLSSENRGFGAPTQFTNGEGNTGGAIIRESPLRPRVVRDPKRAEKLHARETGSLRSA